MKLPEISEWRQMLFERRANRISREAERITDVKFIGRCKNYTAEHPALARDAENGIRCLLEMREKQLTSKGRELILEYKQKLQKETRC